VALLLDAVRNDAMFVPNDDRCALPFQASRQGHASGSQPSHDEVTLSHNKKHCHVI
jgi:hypothetical protein